MDAMWILYAVAPFGMLCFAGFGASGVAQYMLPKIKDQLASPSSVDRAVASLGFWCGVAGAGIIMFGVAVGWWEGAIIFMR